MLGIHIWFYSQKDCDGNGHFTGVVVVVHLRSGGG